jgi:proline-specific peptidase
MTKTPVREGHIDVTGGRVWYRVVGDGGGLPLLTLHGGPGVPHDYLDSLAELADERPVVFYDQLGCGLSDRPDDLTLWTVERFVEEVGQVVAALGPERFHLLGQSWGSMLATDYALTRPPGLVSLILASPPLSIPRWLADADAYRAQLPAAVRDALDRHEAAGTIDSDEYRAATDAYYARHVCRAVPEPAEMTRAMAAMGHAVYAHMWGPNEFNMTGGTLRTYDRTPRLPELAVPTLFTCGRYDEATPEATAWYQSLVPGADLAVFAQSAHLPHLEEREAYLATVRQFVRRVESVA